MSGPAADPFLTSVPSRSVEPISGSKLSPAILEIAAAVASELKRKVALKENALKRRGLEAVEFHYREDECTPLPEPANVKTLLHETCLEFAHEITATARKRWVRDLQSLPEVGDLVLDVFWWTFSAHLRVDPKVVSGRRKQTELACQRSLLRNVQNVALGVLDDGPPDALSQGAGTTTEVANGRAIVARIEEAVGQIVSGTPRSPSSPAVERKLSSASADQHDGSSAATSTGQDPPARSVALTTRQKAAVVADLVKDLLVTATGVGAFEAAERETTAEQVKVREKTFDRIASTYLRLVVRLPGGAQGHLLLRSLPDVISQCCFKAFFLCFERERVRFGAVFRTQLRDLCQEWFSGLRASHAPNLAHWDLSGAVHGVPPSDRGHPAHDAFRRSKTERRRVLNLRKASLGRSSPTGGASPTSPSRRAPSKHEHRTRPSTVLDHARARTVRTRYLLDHSPLVRTELERRNALSRSQQVRAIRITLTEDPARPVMAAPADGARHAPLRARLAERVHEVAGTTTGRPMTNPASVLRATADPSELRAPASSAREATLQISSGGGTGVFAAQRMRTKHRPLHSTSPQLRVAKGVTKGDILLGTVDDDGAQPFDPADTFTAQMHPLLAGRAAWVAPLSSVRLTTAETGDPRDGGDEDGRGGDGGAGTAERRWPVLPHQVAVDRAVAVAPPFALATPVHKSHVSAQSPRSHAGKKRRGTTSRFSGFRPPTSSEGRQSERPPSSHVLKSPLSVSRQDTPRDEAVEEQNHHEQPGPVNVSQRPHTHAGHRQPRDEIERSPHEGPMRQASFPAVRRGREDDSALPRVERQRPASGLGTRRRESGRVLSVVGRGSRPSTRIGDGADPPPSAAGDPRGLGSYLRMKEQWTRSQRTTVVDAAAGTASTSLLLAPFLHATLPSVEAIAAAGLEAQAGRAVEAAAEAAAEEAAASVNVLARARWESEKRTAADQPVGPLSSPLRGQDRVSRVRQGRGPEQFATSRPRPSSRTRPASSVSRPTESAARRRQVPPWHAERVLRHRLARAQVLERAGRLTPSHRAEIEALRSTVLGTGQAGGLRHAREGGAGPQASGAHSALRPRRRSSGAEQGAGADDTRPPGAEAVVGLEAVSSDALRAAGPAFASLLGARAERGGSRAVGAGDYYSSCVTYRDVVELSRERSRNLVSAFVSECRRADAGIRRSEEDCLSEQAAVREQYLAAPRAQAVESILSQQAEAKARAAEERRRRVGQRARNRDEAAAGVRSDARSPSGGGEGGASGWRFDDGAQGQYSAEYEGEPLERRPEEAGDMLAAAARSASRAGVL